MTEERKERQQGQSLITPGYEAGSENCRGCELLHRDGAPYFCAKWNYPSLKETQSDVLRCQPCLESEQEAKGMIPRGEVEWLRDSIKAYRETFSLGSVQYEICNEIIFKFLDLLNKETR